MSGPRLGLKYVRVEELDRSKKRFENSTVEDPNGEKLGKVEGVIIDVNDSNPYYVVVDAGGWFRSKHVLIPIGHVALDYLSGKFAADLTKERLKRFPGFDLDVFQKLTQEDLDRMAEEIGRECCPHLVVQPAQLVSWLGVWPHYQTPTWWDHDFYESERFDENAKPPAGTEP